MTNAQSIISTNFRIRREKEKKHIIKGILPSIILSLQINYADA